MKSLILAILSFISFSVSAAPFLVGDVPGGGDQCVYTRGAPVTSPIVVDAVNGNPAFGNRICKIDLASDPKTGTVTVAVRDSVLGITSTATSYTFATVSPPTNFRLIP